MTRDFDSDAAQQSERKPTRLYVLDDLTEHAEIPLDPKQVHYLRKVMRRREGDAMHVFNGRQGEWRADIVSLERRGGRLEAVELLREQPEEKGPRLCFAPVKRSRLEWMLEKTTELGVARLSPVRTDWTQQYTPRRDRMGLITLEAAEQSERLTLPEIDVETSIDDLLDELDGAPLIVCDEDKKGAPLATLIDPALPPTILIGPEGGFSPEERQMLAECDGVAKASLGPSVLRAETAAIAAIATWRAAMTVAQSSED